MNARTAAGTPGVPAGGAAGAAPARARHRARSPIISPGWQPALLTAALAGLLAAGAAFGQVAALPAVVLLQAVTAAGWFRLNGMWPARQGIVLAFAGGLAADAAVLAVDASDAPGALLGVLGVWFLLVVVLQLRHRGSADERLDALTATSASTLLTVVAGALLAAVEVSGAAVAVAAGGVAAATVVRAVPGPGALMSLLGLAAALGVGAVASGQDIGTPALALGAAGGACALVGLRVASYDFPSRFVHFTAGVALPLTAAAPAVYPLAVALL
ncbi:hypothetical protein FH609_011330 [Streptomyces sp. 3MP-14]|uniref:Uncharacterized protein n=1 Tax=Streptomyces mimosae TaxID=2586635 RepID=A0A5N6AG04_9ACTN|nr:MULTISPECIES: hypothetical protein [Streptomyces]KAB8166993.1 hypothetical protein FH607_008780 [Streptomyces mimosae]KAB8176934.1 hypothetical protein FH609_011330 [Streptomyces sp. 3MP-14]